ncbi:hypothetical protein WJX77_006892 [Trebouxia sp. C0004]
MIGEPGACQHLRSPGTVSCGSHRRSRNRLSTPPQAARQDYKCQILQHILFTTLRGVCVLWWTSYRQSTTLVEQAR